MKNNIELILSDSYQILKLNGEIFAEGHSITLHNWIDLINKMNPSDIVQVIEVSDEQMEEGDYY